MQRKHGQLSYRSQVLGPKYLWEIPAVLSIHQTMPPRRSPKHSKPSISIVQCRHTGYWLVTITCKDRNKLFFDTVGSFPSCADALRMLCPLTHRAPHPPPRHNMPCNFLRTCGPQQ